MTEKQINLALMLGALFFVLMVTHLDDKKPKITRDSCFKSGGTSFEDGDKPVCIYTNPLMEEK